MASAPPPRLQKPLGWEPAQSPFHEGEQRVQARVGVRERIERMGRNIVRDFMPAEHREFFEDLPFVLVGSVDRQGAVWASLLPGEPGFIQAPAPRSLQVQAWPLPGDPLADNLFVGAPLGLLGIELATRRRNRANGRIVRMTGGVLDLNVEQSFGNCKQYIHPRAGVFASPAARALPAPEHARLTPEALAILAQADTSFVATSSQSAERGGTEGVDVSHRGGPPGFIHAEQTETETRLTLPDYSGNFMFNSFGNLEVNPHAGLLALDFRAGALLSLTGTAHVIWDDPRVALLEGAQRLLEFRVRSGWLWRGVLQQWA